MTTAASDSGSSAELEGLIVQALFHLQRHWNARDRLEAALRAFAVHPRGALLQAARLLFADNDLALHGWVGLAPDLSLIGQVRDISADHSIEIETDQSPTQWLGGTDLELKPQSIFRIRALDTAHQSRVRVASDGQDLLGSPLPAASGFELDGRVSGISRQVLRGWVRDRWNPLRPIPLKVEDENGNLYRLKVDGGTSTDGRCHFEIDLKTAPLDGTRLTISARLADQAWHPLPDAPFLLARAIRPYLPTQQAHTSARTGATRADASPVRVIIPVYQGLDETLTCLGSVIRTLPPWANILVVDDASPDPRLSRELDTLASQGLITLIRNPRNLGFVGAVNRALATLAGQDCVLLNSDACVFGDWLERLRRAAYSKADIGTVTPFSSDGTIVSYPLSPAANFGAADAFALDGKVQQRFPGLTVDLPVAVGFCMYLKWDCLQQTGVLDEALFGKGYGEESDLCMKARALGWRHVLAADVYVHHIGGRSFGGRRTALLERAARIINLRHPGYDALVTGFIKADPVGPLRRVLDEDRLLEDRRPKVLIVSLAGSGGVDRYLVERSRQLFSQGLVPVVLCPLWDDQQYCVLFSPGLPLQHLRYRQTPAGLAPLGELMSRLELDHVEIHHFLGLDARLVERAMNLGVPYDVYIHDYIWACPRITMIDGSRRYCGEPALKTCEQCIKTDGAVLTTPRSVGALRRRSAQWLSGARRVIAPTFDVSSRIQRYFPAARIDVTPWQPTIPDRIPAMPGSDAQDVGPAGASKQVAIRSPSRKLKIAVLGAIGPHKGYHVLLACARDARKRRLPLEFCVVGYTKNDIPLLNAGVIGITGQFKEGEAPELLRKAGPDLIFLPSVCPETWSYTLTEAFDSGIPVLAFDLGSIAERIRATGKGEVLPLGLSPKLINDHFLKTRKRQK